MTAGHYAAALLWALDKALRGDFTPAVKAAWIRIFGVLSQGLRASMTDHAHAA
jgi:hypothetical protein